jgi:heptosyltransferase-2
LGIPVLALFGSTEPRATCGLGPVTALYKKVDCSPCFSRTCARKDMLCMNSITVNEVMEHLENWLTEPSS